MVHFTPKHKTRIAALKLDPKEFRKIVDDHVIGVLYYVNDEEGITYAVQSGKIDFVEYGPTRKMNICTVAIPLMKNCAL